MSALRSTAGQFRRLSIAIGVADYFIVLAALIVSYLLRFGATLWGREFVVVFIVAPPAFVAVFAAFRLYSSHRFASAEEFRRVFYSVTVGITGIVAVSYWTKAELSRLWIGYTWAITFVAVAVGRRAWHHYIYKARRRGRLTYRTLLVGSNDEAAHLARVMASVPTGFEPVGYISTGNGGEAMGELRRFGEVSDLPRAIGDAEAGCVFVASSALRERDMAVATKAARSAGIEVRVSANIPEMLTSRLSAQPLGGVMAFSVWPVKLEGARAVVKRSFDLLAGGVLLVVGSLLWIPIAIAVKAGSRGPSVYRQVRVGRHGREFTMLKFRTMAEGAESVPPENEAEGPLFKARRDPRVTGIGRFLRRWSLDEIPQLVNVVRGDMSLVGPRPPLPSEVERYEDWQRDRLEVRPGITGLWQVSGRSELSFDDYVRLDIFYIENWSLTYDLYLVAKTVPAVLSRRGAF